MTRSPRIAILTPYSFAEFHGGVEVFNAQLTAILPGVQSFFMKRSEGHARLRWSLDSIGLEHPRRAWHVAQHFLREHRRRPFQLAICNGLYGWALSAFPPGIPMIQVYHYTLAGLARKGIAERGVQLHLRYLDGTFDRFSGTGKEVVAVGHNILEEVRGLYHLDGRIIPNGVDTEIFRKRDRFDCRDQLHLPQNTRIGLFVGRAEYTKGFDILHKVILGSPDTLFVLAGGAPPLGANTVAVPRVPHEEMPAYYSAADFLILPSRYEGFNLTILEAIACDLPILVSRAAYPLEDDPRDLGVVVDSGDPEVYVRALHDLPGSAEGTSHRQRILESYTLENFAQRWRGLALGLIGMDSDEWNPPSAEQHLG